MIFALPIATLIAFAPMLAVAAEVIIPRGTAVFGALDERVTSNSRKFDVGDEIDGHVWKDVIVDGHTVIPAGTSLLLRIAKLDSRNVGGRGGSLEIMAISVEAVDGTEISLDGGYDQAGGDRYGLTRALSYLIWPTAFLPGRRAVLEEGTVFDAAIPADTRIALPDHAIPTLKLGALSDLTVEVLYDEIDQRDGTLPLELTLCNRDFVRQADVIAVNENGIRPILVTIITSRRGDPCHVFAGRVNLEQLTKHFSPGINRFAVTMGEAQASVVLNVEM
jgi:hypothetical protein